MADLNEIYRCGVCGNIVQLIHNSFGELVCCNNSMVKLAEQNADFKLEKHVPIVEKIDHGYSVKVGNIPHPMEDSHYIEWIELIVDLEISYRKYLKPGDRPEAIFYVDANHVTAREYCNIHKLWKN
jgi:superoxide reductase